MSKTQPIWQILSYNCGSSRESSPTHTLNRDVLHYCRRLDITLSLRFDQKGYNSFVNILYIFKTQRQQVTCSLSRNCRPLICSTLHQIYRYYISNTGNIDCSLFSNLNLQMSELSAKKGYFDSCVSQKEEEWRRFNKIKKIHLIIKRKNNALSLKGTSIFWL